MNKLFNILKNYPLYRHIERLKYCSNTDRANQISTLSTNKIDYLSLSADWQAVGDDLRKSMCDYR